ncbi:MAG: hypothetical protein OHK0013_12020 [Sandaracinaceae bacterium]
MSAKLRLGIAGLHNQGREHVAATLDHPRFVLSAVADPDEGELSWARSAVGAHLHLHRDAVGMIASGEIDAAVVALPHDLHAAVVDAAARYGVHLLKEKPLARSLREAITMSSRMRAAGRVLCTGVQRRHHATYVQLREALRDTRVTSASIEMVVVPSGSGGTARLPAGDKMSFGPAAGCCSISAITRSTSHSSCSVRSTS